MYYFISIAISLNNCTYLHANVKCYSKTALNNEITVEEDEGQLKRIENELERLVRVCKKIVPSSFTMRGYGANDSDITNRVPQSNCFCMIFLTTM